MNKPTALNQQTTISIALVSTLVMAAFWVGGNLTKVTIKVEHLRETQMAIKELSEELKEMARQNKQRIDYIEDRVE